MRRDILSAVLRKTETRMLEQTNIPPENPIYEDPRDIIGAKPMKSERKKVVQGIATMTNVTSKERKHSIKDHKKRLAKKYESLIVNLMDKCEEYANLISQKDTHVTQLKEKLKQVLDYNKLFAEENDQLKDQHATLIKYIEECKKVLKEERDKHKELMMKNKDLEKRVREFNVPDKEYSDLKTAIPLVEVCMNCTSRQILLNQAREQNSRLQKDMQALKDVLYRLNVQLSKYQDKLRSDVRKLSVDGRSEHVYKPGDKNDILDSLITASLAYKGQGNNDADEGQSRKTDTEDKLTSIKLVELSGLLSAQALAPLFDAYQENIQEKENLILDYEKQFENMNKKSKRIVLENKNLSERLTSIEEELLQARQSYKKFAVEKETGDIEKATLVERAERAESKLKEVYELYEDKMSGMLRDYETVHREYYNVRTALHAVHGRAARTVPADLHERRIEHCKRLLEELKHQYGMESERKNEQIKKLQEQVQTTEEKYHKLCEEHESVKLELNTALKDVRLYRKAAAIFRGRVRASRRDSRVRTSARRPRHSALAAQPLRLALHTLQRIKNEIKLVKSRAYSSLEELEQRIVEQERRAAHAQSEYRRELERATLALQHKEAIIRSLIDKVADVEEVRLSQVNTHRLQGIVSSSEDSMSRDNVEPDDRPAPVQ